MSTKAKRRIAAGLVALVAIVAVVASQGSASAVVMNRLIFDRGNVANCGGKVIVDTKLKKAGSSTNVRLVVKKKRVGNPDVNGNFVYGVGLNPTTTDYLIRYEVFKRTKYGNWVSKGIRTITAANFNDGRRLMRLRPTNASPSSAQAYKVNVSAYSPSTGKFKGTASTGTMAGWG